MNSEDYLVGKYSIDDIKILKPKKNGIFLLSKIGTSHDDSIIIQLPKMKFKSVNDKLIELEFLKNSSEYNKESLVFLNKLDSRILQIVHENSEEWFGQTIPIESVQKMYSSNIINIITGISSENTSKMRFKFKNLKDLSFVDHRNDELIFSDISDIPENSNVESIAQIKYLVFSKDKFHVIWELLLIKLNKPRVHRVPKFGFIEDSNDSVNDSVNDIPEIKEYSFF